MFTPLPDEQNYLDHVPRILHLEDKVADREIVREMIRNAGIECEMRAVETREAFVDKITRESWDLILSDYSLPAFDGAEALQIASKVCPATPFIFVTGTMGEDRAVESLKGGATDYVLKQRMARLVPTVRRALDERAERLKRQKAEEELAKTEERLRFLAYHDPLTDLPNRAQFRERLPQILADATRRGERVALLYIDLDHFKNINDSLGHPAGDAVLRQIAELLKGCTRSGETVARLGGDEFVVVVSAVNDSTDAGSAADRIRRELSAEFVIEGRFISTTCSIGISISPEDGGDIDSLLRNADAALSSAKEEGRNQWQCFIPEMNRRAEERLLIESGLRLALKEQQFFLEYQPQIQLSTGKIIGAEALIRWQHPEEGLIPPNRFIPSAESTGEIIPIGAWVLRTACAQAKQWQEEGLPAISMAVNISAVQIRHGQLIKTVRDILDETGLAPEYLELETTESLLLAHDEKMAAQMRGLRDLGVRMALDDFGTGYSSFSYVRRFRFDRLKIDGSFVQNLNTDPNGEIIAGIINFGATLKLEVIAECAETKEQVEILRSLGCDQIQGYYFSRPVGAAAFAEMVRAQSTASWIRPRVVPNPLQLSRNKLEMAISLSETLMGNLPAVICIFNAAGEVRRWNTNYLGYSFDEMLQTGITGSIAPDHLDLVQQTIRDVIEQGKAETEAWLIAKSGTKIPCYLTGVRIVFEDEPCILGVAIDISKQKQAEEESRQSQQATNETAVRLKAIFESVQTGIVIIDPETHRILDANPAALQIMGSSIDRVLGAECHQFICPAQCGMCPVTDLGQTIDHSERVLLTASGERRQIINTVVTVQIAGRDHLVESFTDITERKQAEESLKLFRTLVDQANDGIEVVDPQTLRYLDVNERTCRNLGYTRDELLSMRVSDVNAHIEELKDLVEERFRNQQSVQFETEQRRKDGSVFPVEVAIRLVQLDRPYAVSIVHDITERKRSEESLKLFRALLDQSSDAIHVIDPETFQYVDANEKACVDLGYTREQLLSLRVPDVDAGFDETSGQVMEHMRTSGHALFETLHRRKDGSTFPAEVAVNRVVIGKPYLVSVARDITERRHYEASLKVFRALIDQSNDTVTISDRDTLRFIDVNEGACSNLGYTREELLSMSMSDIVIGLPEVQERMREAMQSHGSIVFEVTARRKDGSTFPIEVSAKEVVLNRRYLLAISRDMTGRKLMMEKLRSSEAHLALKNRLAEILLTTHDDEMYGAVLNVVSQELGSECGMFGFIDEEGALVVPSLRGQIWEECKMQGKGLRFPRETWGGAWGCALKDKASFVSNQRGRILDGHVPIDRYLVAPILHQDQAIGVLAVANRSTDYDEADKVELVNIASYLAPVLQARLQRDAQERAREKAEEEVLRLSRTDALTGLANRRMLEETLPREVARAMRLHESLAVIFADLDHFKAVNDQCGHQAGDHVLSCVAEILKRQLRAYALGARLGGDEFVLLLPGTTKDSAVIVAERIREQVAASSVPDCSTPFALSLGIATFKTDDSGASLLARADGALYQAKAKGGNRVEVA